MEALLADGRGSLSPLKRKRREQRVGTAAPSALGAAASAGRPQAVGPTVAGPAAGGRAAADGLLRVKKVRKKHGAEEQELRSILAPLAAAGAAAPSGAAGLLVASTPHLHSRLQEQQRQHQDRPHAVFQQGQQQLQQSQQQSGEVKLLEDLFVRRRLPVLRSCLLPSPSPSLQSLVLQRLAGEAGAFPAAFSPFRLHSHTAALPATAAAEDGGSSANAAAGGEGGENDEGRAVVAFLCFLKEALEAAPAAAVSFDAAGRLRGRRTAVLLKHVEPAAAAAAARQAKSHQSGSSGDCSANSNAGGSSNSDVRASTCGSNGKSKSAKTKSRSSGSTEGGHGGERRAEGREERKGKEEGAGAEDCRKFLFEAPVEVHVVGSFPLNLTTCFSKNVDVCVMMPPHMFGPRDHINYRYFNKRNAYIQLLYEHLRDFFAAVFSPSSSAAAAPDNPARGCPRAAGVSASGGPAAPSAAAGLAAAPRPRADSPSGGAPGADAAGASGSSAFASAAFSRCAASAAAFKAAAPHVVPRVFLQAWQGCVEKPVIAVRFVVVREKQEGEGEPRRQQQKLRRMSSSRPEQLVSPVEQQEAWTLQQQVLLQQWVVRVLAVPCPAPGPETEDKEQQQHVSNSTHHSSGDKETGGSSSKKASSGSGGDKRKPFAEHMLAVDRNCVREPTTCCRDLSFAIPAATTAPAEGSVGSAAADSGAEDSAATQKQQQHQETDELPPTPCYNMLLLEDLRLRQHQRLLYRCCRLYGDGFREAVLLLKVWALRRGFVAADNACGSASVRAAPAAGPSPPPPLLHARTAWGAAEEEAFWWKEASDVSGFLLAMLCCHACLAAADTLAAPVLAQQLLSLTLSFLAEADFLRFIYILGDPQPYRRQEDLKTLRAALVLSSSGGAEAATEEAVAAGRGVAGGLQRGRKTAPLHAAPGTAAQAGATAEGGERVDAAGLSVGLMDEAYLFDSPSCCFNLLWRAQLHVAELQQEARSSLQALQRPADAYHFVFAPPSSAMPSDLAGSPGGDSSNLSSSGRSSEHAQLHLLLQGDVQLYIPRVPQQPHLYFPAAAYPVGNYLPFTLRPQLLRGTAAVAAAEAAAASTPTGGSSSELAGLDALPKWETPQPVLLAASLLRLLVRGLGDRLRCYRVRVRRWCRPPAAPAAAAGSAAGLPAEDDAQDDTAMAGQPLAWTAKTAEAFLRGGPPAATGLVVSLELNAATAARLVEKGPSAAVAATVGGTPAAAAEAVESFRLFWGPARVEVRRFHDAQTLFAVVWDRPSDEDQQLRTLLLQSPASGAGASAAAAAVSSAAAPLPRRSPAGRAAAAGGGGAAAGAHPADQQTRQLLLHPPPHTQVIRHLLRRHLPHLLVLLSAEDPQPQQQEPQHQHGQSSMSKWHGTQTAPSGKGRSSSTTKGSSAIPGAAASDAALCILASTPLGAVPGLSSRHKQLVQTFNELRNTICSLSSLPLAVKQIWHAGTALRFADATPLSASDTSATTGAEDAMDRGIHRVVVEFEDSAAWPEEAAAVRHVKVAFLLAMRKELLSDHGICAVVSPCCCLDVELGLFTFRVVIFHPAEAAAAAALYAELRWEPLYSYLRQRATHTEFVASRDNRSSPTSSSGSGGATEGGSSSTRGGRRSKKKRGSGGQQTAEGDEAAEAASAQQQQLYTLFNNIDAEDEDAVLASPFATPLFARKHLAAAEQEEEEQRLSCLRYMWWEPQVAAVLHACALRYPPFAGCVRLAKRWVAEKQLPACMHLVEHIVTVVFVAACDWGYAAPPQSVHVAFIRFLHLVAGFDWEAEPFIVCFDPDAPLGVQREQLMRLSFEKFHRYPSVQSLFDPHGFIIPLPDAVAFARFLRSARSALASIVQVPFCPSLASTVWKDIFSFSEWSSMDFVLFLRKDLSVTDTKRTKKRYANDFRPTALPACVASVSFGGGEAAAVAQLLLRAATSSQHHVGEMGNTSQPGARMLFSPSYVRRFVFLRFLRELLCSVWTGNEATFCASDPTLLGVRSALSLAYNPLKGALQGGGMPVAIGVKLNIPRAHSGGFSLFLARSLQPSVTFPRCCFSVKNDAEADEARQADVDQATEAEGKGKSAAYLTEEGSGSKMVDCLNPVLLMAGLFAAGGELVESIQICGC